MLNCAPSYVYLCENINTEHAWFCVYLRVFDSLANTRLNHKWDVVWRPPMHFPVEEAWFPIVQSRLLGATNVYHKRLFVALSQSYQLYQNDYTFKINFGSKLSRTLSTDGKRASLLLQPCWIRMNELQASVCRIVRVIVFPSLLVLWLDIKSSQILARGTGHSHQTVWQIEISSAQGSMGIPRLGVWCKYVTFSAWMAPQDCPCKSYRIRKPKANRVAKHTLQF